MCNVHSEFVFLFQVTCGVVVKAYENGKIADAHIINKRSMDFLWFSYLKRLAKFHLKNLSMVEDMDDVVIN